MLFTTITVAFLCASFISAIPVQSSGYDASWGFYGDGTINPQELFLSQNRPVSPPAARPAQADQRNSKSKTPDLAVPAQASGSSSSSRKGAKELSSSARKKPGSQSASKGKDRATSSSTSPPPLKVIKSGSKPYQCNKCTESFKYPGRLQTHVDREHEGKPPPYQCTEPGCGRGFWENTGLTKHILTHTDKDGKPFSCPHCDNKRYGKASHLNRHISEKHSQEKQKGKQKGK
ncbi:hypothetical protein C8J56DRAFT_1164127 [Mycena floridula]|nr:hypothetical protein C8J56DRAFT_1164127 [Mycena floridula]